jgi:hypothetical protein
VKRADRTYISAVASRYMRSHMGFDDCSLTDDQEANFQWRHLSQFGRLLLEAMKRRDRAVQPRARKEPTK